MNDAKINTNEVGRKYDWLFNKNGKLRFRIFTLIFIMAAMMPMISLFAFYMSNSINQLPGKTQAQLYAVDIFLQVGYAFIIASILFTALLINDIRRIKNLMYVAKKLGIDVTKW